MALFVFAEKNAKQPNSKTQKMKILICRTHFFCISSILPPEKIQAVVVGKKKCQTTNIKNSIEAFTEQMGLEERKGTHYIFFLRIVGVSLRRLADSEKKRKCPDVYIGL